MKCKFFSMGNAMLLTETSIRILRVSAGTAKRRTGHFSATEMFGLTINHKTLEKTVVMKQVYGCFVTVCGEISSLSAQSALLNM